ncbi:globin domain-containing protein [Phenylobacterium sp.]|uniref:globin domain-containing protein n=1 Tax=Phenylobacterium sp. TaxID=1871053 RepID=UPI0035B13E2D
MTQTPAFARAAEIEASLERLAERGDPVEAIYERLFQRHPQMKPYFWRDTNGAVKGEMLSRTFEAIFDFVGERRYADHMIRTEMITHEGYDVPREVFATFFEIVRDTARDLLAADWTDAFEAAWTELLAEIDRYVQSTARVEAGDNAYFVRQREAFEREGVAES